MRKTSILGLFAAAGLVFAGPANPAHAQASTVDKDLVAQAGDTLTFAGSGGALGNILKGLLADFTAETGIEVQYLEGPLMDLYGRIMAERGRPSIDVFFSSSVVEARGLKDGIYAPLDPEIVTNLDDVYDIGRIPEDRGVRFGLTDLGFIYSKKAFAEAGVAEPDAWEDFWDPAIKGRQIIGDTTSTYTVLYIAYLTKMLGGDESAPEPGIEYVAERKDDLLAVVRTYPERMQLISSGEAWITVDVGFTSVPELVRNPDIGYLSPGEGSPLFWLGLHTIEGAPNPIGAQLLINYLISPEVQAKWARESWVGPINKTVELDDELAAVVPYGDRLDSYVEVDYAAISENLERYRELWNEQIAPR